MNIMRIAKLMKGLVFTSFMISTMLLLAAPPEGSAKKPLGRLDTGSFTGNKIRNDLEIDNVIVKPKDIWKRLNISNKINNHQLVTLKKLAELRENEAITKDIPRKWIMADTLLFKISTCKASQLDQVISDTRVKLSTKILNKVREIVLNNKTVLLKDNKAVNIEEYHAQITKCNNIMDSVSNKYNIAPSFIASSRSIHACICFALTRDKIVEP